MDHRPSLTPNTRDRGIRRLRTLTLATTVASSAALVGFGFVAAVSNPGHATPSAAAQDQTGASGATDQGSTSSSTTGATATPAPIVFQAVPQLPNTVAGGGQTTTGGS